MAEATRELNSELESLGFVFVRRNKHAIWKYGLTGAMLTVSSTASDYRSIKNTLSDARRIIRLHSNKPKEEYAAARA